MGCFSTRCTLTNLQFKEGDPVILVPLIQHEKSGIAPCYSDDKWNFAGLAMTGEYNDYGSAEGFTCDAYDINIKILSRIKGFDKDTFFQSNRLCLKSQWNDPHEILETDLYNNEHDRISHALVHPDAWNKAVEIAKNWIAPEYSLVHYLSSGESEELERARKIINLIDSKEEKDKLLDIIVGNRHPISVGSKNKFGVIKYRLDFPRLPNSEQLKVAQIYDDMVRVSTFMSHFGLYWQPTFDLGPQSRTETHDTEMNWAKFKLELLKKQKKADRE